MEPRVAGREQLLPRGAIPVYRVNRVENAARLSGDRFPLPLAGPIKINGHRITLHRWELFPNHRPQQQHRLAVPLRVNPAHPVCGGHAIEFAREPRLAHIAAVSQEDHVADARLGASFKMIRQDHLGNPVVVKVAASGIQRSRNIRRQDMPFPGWILVPSDLGIPLRDSQQVFFPIAVQVHRHELIPELQCLTNDLPFEPRQVRGGHTNAGQEQPQADARRALGQWHHTRL
jgi:hypothetical protein